MQNIFQHILILLYLLLSIKNASTFYVCFGSQLPMHIFLRLSKMYSEQCQISKIELFCKNSKRLSTVNYFRKKFHLRCLTLFWIHLRQGSKKCGIGNWYLKHTLFSNTMKNVLISLKCLIFYCNLFSLALKS